MKLAAVKLRVRASLIAVAVAWATAVIVTLPMQFVKIYSNAIDGPRAFLLSLCAVTLIWCAWSLAIASLAWLGGGLPVIAIVRECWLLRHHRRAIVISGALGWAVVLFKFQIWKQLLPDEGFAIRGFILYTLLLVVFTGAAAAVYLRLVAQIVAKQARRVQSVNQ